MRDVEGRPLSVLEGHIAAVLCISFSPDGRLMASKASDVYRHHPDYYDEETAKLLREGDTPLDYPNQTITNDAKASRAIESITPRQIAAAESGPKSVRKLMNGRWADPVGMGPRWYPPGHPRWTA